MRKIIETLSAPDYYEKENSYKKRELWRPPSKKKKNKKTKARGSTTTIRPTEASRGFLEKG
jgi:hypothetical protein